MKQTLQGKVTYQNILLAVIFLNFENYELLIFASCSNCVKSVLVLIFPHIDHIY